MKEKREPLDRLFDSLKERSKELNCLYQIEETLNKPDEEPEEAFHRVVRAVPSGFQHPEICQASIRIENKTYAPKEFRETPWALHADIVFQDMVIGTLSVFYTEERPAADHGPFLKEEAKLIETIAARLMSYIVHLKMRRFVRDFENARKKGPRPGRREWQVVLNLLKQTDLNLYHRVSRKMLNYLCWSGVGEAERLLQSLFPDQIEESGDAGPEDWNIPGARSMLAFSPELGPAVFGIAASRLDGGEILGLIQKWIQEEKLNALAQVVNRQRPLGEVADALRRFQLTEPGEGEAEVRTPAKRGVAVSLIRRILGDQLEFINVAKEYIGIRDFYNLLPSIVYCPDSQGKLGGKSSGLYLAAQILRKKSRENDLLANVKVPRTWYLSSDVHLEFVHYNDFDEVIEQKYKESGQIRVEYPHIVQSFKSARFPPEIVKGLSMALDELGDTPLIVRSSSLLEDRLGTAFSGKYKSLFLANQGSKRKRLDALMDAVAEVFASTFSPDPIEYRAERGLLDFWEEMGVMIQEVVGTRVGRYFLPSFAGVAFSRNEFRWSPRIEREDGLVRIVPGLGTRAVDRVSDDFPVLIAPGRPGLRANVSVDEIVRYSPGKIDVIDLEGGSFKTVALDAFLKEAAYELPGINDIVSIFRDGDLKAPMGISDDLTGHDLVATFEGLIGRTPFVKMMHAILTTLEDALGTPVDIEFASDGRNFHLLQCRPQSYSPESKPARIPDDVPGDRQVFTANRFVSNGRIPDITHIVYVDPRGYAAIDERPQLLAVARAVGRLNKILPRRRFILMGPGRWGSRGDIKLGVSVTYSDINNTAVLVEIARQKGNYVPELSFGTHFFQDLVEANIRYLPLYPDDPGVVFNESFLTGGPNALPGLLPEFTDLSDTVRVIDVAARTGGQVLHLLMNAELDRALAMLGPREES